MKLIFASSNPHKLEEMQSALANAIELVSLADAGIEKDIPEP
jgi:inosine/xanthosine triphosphate pyrophosphatase family protein